MSSANMEKDMMEKDMLEKINLSTFNVIASYADKLLTFFTDLDIQTVGLSACAILTIIGASSYVMHKIQDAEAKHERTRNGLMKGKDYRKYADYGTPSENFNYHKTLNELHNACNNCSNIFNSMKCVKLISLYPELVNVRLFSDGVTPFHRVCFHGNGPLIELMLAKGADPELKTIAGENALSMALYYYLYTEQKDLTCLDLLHRKGCQLNYGDEWYEIFMDLAIKSNNKNLMKWMITHSTRSTANFIRASSAPL